MKSLIQINMVSGNFILVGMDAEPTFENMIEYMDKTVLMQDRPSILFVEDIYKRKHAIVYDKIVSLSVEYADKSKMAEARIQIVEYA